MIKAGVRANFSAFADNLKAIQADLDKFIPEVVDEAAARMCQSFLDHSYPAQSNDPTLGLGNTTEALEQGKRNIEHDIRRMFVTTGYIPLGNLIMQKNWDAVWANKSKIVFRNASLQKAWDGHNAAAIYKAFKKAGWVPGPKIFFADKPNENLHKKMRDAATGAVRKDILEHPELRAHIRSDLDLERLIQLKCKTIGKSANGWAEILSKLSKPVVKVLPGKGSGTVKKNGVGRSYSIFMENKYGDFNGMVSKTGIMNDIIVREANKFVDELQSRIDKAFLAHQTRKNQK